MREPWKVNLHVPKEEKPVAPLNPQEFSFPQPKKKRPQGMAPRQPKGPPKP